MECIYKTIDGAEFKDSVEAERHELVVLRKDPLIKLLMHLGIMEWCHRCESEGEGGGVGNSRVDPRNALKFAGIMRTNARQLIKVLQDELPLKEKAKKPSKEPEF